MKGLSRTAFFQIPAYESPPKAKFQGSLPIQHWPNTDPSQYSTQKDHWLEQIEDHNLLDRYTPNTWSFSKSAQQAFLNWGLEGWSRFVPLLRAVKPLEDESLEATEHMANAFNIKKSVSTIPILGEIAVNLLEQLPSVHSMEDALAQFTAVLSAVNDTAFYAARKYHYKPDTPIREQGFSDLCVLQGDGLQIGPFNDHLDPSIYSSIQRGQIVFIAKNGAMQIVKLPSPQQLSLMIQKDDHAKAYIDTKQPLSQEDKRRQLSAYGPHMGISATLQLLETYHQTGIPEDRITPSGWTDLHRLLETVPFDFKKHIQEGRLSVLMDKPNNATQQGVWEVESSVSE